MPYIIVELAGSKKRGGFLRVDGGAETELYDGMMIKISKGTHYLDYSSQATGVKAGKDIISLFTDNAFSGVAESKDYNLTQNFEENSVMKIRITSDTLGRITEPPDSEVVTVSDEKMLDLNSLYIVYLNDSENGSINGEAEATKDFNKMMLISVLTFFTVIVPFICMAVGWIKQSKFTRRYGYKPKRSGLQGFVSLLCMIGGIAMIMNVSRLTSLRRPADEYSTDTYKDDSSYISDNEDKSSEIPSQSAGKYISIPPETEIFDIPEANGVSKSFYDTAKGVIIGEDGEWYKAEIYIYETHTSMDGWCRKSDVSIDNDSLEFPADKPLDSETAKKMYEYITELPYYLFLRFNKLDFNDCYPITFDDGFIAAYAYAAYGVKNTDDFLRMYSNIGTKEYLENNIRCTGPDIEHVSDKLYFTYPYAWGDGGYFSTIESFEKISDEEYILKTVLGDGSEIIDETYYKIIVEDGRYKFSKAASDVNGL